MKSSQTLLDQYIETTLVDIYHGLQMDIRWYRRMWWIYPLLALAMAALLGFRLYPGELYWACLAIVGITVSVMPYLMIRSAKKQCSEYLRLYPVLSERYQRRYKSSSKQNR